MVNRSFILVFFCLQLIACGVIKEQSTVLLEGNTIVTPSWIDITPMDARVSLKNFESNVLKRRSYTFTDGKNKVYREALQLKNKNGVLVYAEFENSDERFDEPLKDYVKSIFAEHPQFKKAGMKWDVSYAKETSQSQKSRLAYGLMKSPIRSCFVFARDLGKDKSNYKLILGSLCNSVSNKKFDEFIDKQLKIAQAVEFDNGEHTRSNLFVKANNELDALLIAREKAEKQEGPIISLTQVLRQGGSLWVKGRINGNPDIVRLAGLPLKPLSKDGHFVAHLDGVNETTPMKITAIDKYGNSSTVKLYPETVTDFPDSDINTKIEYYPSANEKGKIFALLIAMADYENPNFSDLAATVNGVTKLRDTLKKYYDFSEINKENLDYAFEHGSAWVEILQSPKYDELNEKLKKLSKVLTPNDKLLIYYAGHGYMYPSEIQKPKTRQVSHWLLKDSSHNDTKAWFSDQELRQWVTRLPTRQVMVVADSCYAGALVGDSVDYKPDGENLFARTIMTSGKDKPVTGSTDKFRSVFAISFDKKLQDLSEQVNLTGISLYKEIEEYTEEDDLTEPQYGILTEVVHDDGADFSF